MKKTGLTMNGQPLEPDDGSSSAQGATPSAPMKIPGAGLPSPSEAGAEAATNAGAAAPMSGTPDDSNLTLEEKIIAAIQTVHDPEIPINIYDLGLIYDIKIDPPGKINIKMTLTSPACPVAEELPIQVQTKVQCLAEATFVYVELVWDPPWTPELMTDDARLILGI
jgi:FeS assembly SUF system protein